MPNGSLILDLIQSHTFQDIGKTRIARSQPPCRPFLPPLTLPQSLRPD